MNSTLRRLAASGTATVLLAGGATALAATAASAGTGATSTTGTTQTANTHAAQAATTPRCLNTQLAVSVRDVGDDDEGIYNLNVDFKNTSRTTCHLDGYPGVSAVGTHGNQLGNAATRNAYWPARIINLTPGYTAHSVLAYDSYAAHNSACAPATANGFRIYPPGDYYAMYAPYKVTACTKTGYNFLSVGRVKAAGLP
jgi:hypothetical protein